MKNKRSFRKIVETSKKWLTVLTILVVGFFFLSSWKNANAYHQIFEGYSDLQGYYENIKDSCDEMKKYLTTGKGNYLNRYEQSVKDAKIHISNILDNPIIHNKWRFKLLKNMLVGYEQSADELMKQYAESANTSNYSYYYERFLKDMTLIQETSTQYYHYVTDSMNAQKMKLDRLQMMTYLVAGVVSIALILWMRYFSQLFYTSISKPLETVLEHVSMMKQGNYNVKIASQSSLEIEELCIALEEMASKIAHNMEIQKEKTELEKKLVQSELKMLQNQINPHFLFNTLNMIYCMADKEGAYDAADMLLKTSHLLRYGLEMQNRLSTFEGELNSLQDYIDIQKKRFEDKIEIKLDLQNMDEIRQLPVPGMIFQPLVENSIKHGLKNCVKDGLIGIQIRKVEDQIKIMIFDNGQGMPKAELAKMKQKDFAFEKGSLGMYNVMHRLKTYYGDRLQIDIRSDVDCGFAIYLTINI